MLFYLYSVRNFESEIKLTLSFKFEFVRKLTVFEREITVTVVEPIMCKVKTIYLPINNNDDGGWCMMIIIMMMMMIVFYDLLKRFHDF